jgi:hypothetical protein
MSAEPELAPILRTWLEDRTSPPPQAGLIHALGLVATTPQRRPAGIAIPRHRSIRRPLDTTAGRSRTMVTVTRLVAATAIAAAGTAGLFLAASPPPTPVVPPSPSPVAWTLPAGLVTEEVEPGVLRIVSDGVRELSWVPPVSDRFPAYCCYYQNAIGVAPDGVPWFFRSDGFFRLGAEPTYPWTLDQDPWGSTIKVTYRGQPQEGESGLWLSADGQLLRAHLDVDPSWSPVGPADRVAVDSSGTISAVARPLGGAVTLSRSSDGGISWTTDAYPGPDSDFIDLWASGGATWLRPLDRYALWRFDGTEWQEIDIPAVSAGDPMMVNVGVGSDGTVWAHWKMEDPDGGWSATSPEQWARLQGGAWTTFDAPAELPRASSPHDGGLHFAVAPDGALWLAPAAGLIDSRGCDGLARFDGVELRRFLPGLCMYGLEIGPDGSVWVLAGADYWEADHPPVETYLIPAPVAETGR